MANPEAPASLVGAKVEIHGLTGRPDLNGRIGHVTGVRGDRVAVSMFGTGVVAIRPANLTRQSGISAHPRPTHVDDDEIIAKGCDPDINKADPCGDGDQSPLKEVVGPGQMLREVWARGGDLNPWLSPQRYSTFFAACAWGDVLAVGALLSGQEGEPNVELERRESKLRYSPLHVIVAGSRNVYGSTDWPRRGAVLPEIVPDHCAVAALLIEQRANLEARDILGQTPLGLACGTHATEGSLKVARVLASGGASVNVADRFGHPMLMKVMMLQNGADRLDVVEALLQMGADLDRKYQMSHLGSMSMIEVVQKARSCGMVPEATTAPLLKLFARYSKQPNARAAVAETSVRPDTSAHQRLAAAASDLGVQDLSVASSSSAPEASKLEYGTPVRVGRLTSRPELNGKRGYILGFSDGRYEIELADGAQMRLKADNVAEDPDGDDNASVDPRKLRCWPGLGVAYVKSLTSKTPQRDNMPVVWCFQLAMPLGAKMTLSSNMLDEKALAPFAQWVYSLFHVIANWESGCKAADSGELYRCWRVSIEDEDETETIMIDFLDTVRECPPFVPATQPSVPDESQRKAGNARYSAPLLPIRYLHLSRAQRDVEKRLAVVSKTMPSAGDPVTKHASKQMGCECTIAKVRAASVAEIAAGLENLRTNEAMISADYREWFFGLSPAHGGTSGFRPSFLVPPMEPKGSKPPPRCTGCDRQQADGEKFQQCGRCGSLFCSKACLQANWKEHKKVCRKQEEKLVAPPPDPQRTSIVFDLRPDPTLPQYHFNISMIGAASKGPHKVDPTQAPKNIHGSREFAVKVQPPPGVALGQGQGVAACMVYDEARSFSSFLSLATSGIEAVLGLIQRYGVHKAGGSKGYFMARREGTRLRIFADKLLPPPAW